MPIKIIQFIEDTENLVRIKLELEKTFLIKELNYTPKGDKNMKELVKTEQKLMALKKIRKIFYENFLENPQEKDPKNKRPIYNFRKIAINFYGMKTDVQSDKSNNIKINLSYPINEDLLLKLVNNKIDAMKKKSNITLNDLKNNSISF